MQKWVGLIEKLLDERPDRMIPTNPFEYEPEPLWFLTEEPSNFTLLTVRFISLYLTCKFVVCRRHYLFLSLYRSLSHSLSLSLSIFLPLSPI